MQPSDLAPYMLTLPDGSVVVSTREQIQELRFLPPDQQLKRLEEMEAARDKGGPHDET